MAGEPVIRLTRSMQFGVGTIGGTVETVSDGASITFFQETFGVVTNQEIDITATITKLKCIGIVADKACTLKTNSTSTPGNTYNLIANKPLLWADTDAAANPVSVDITKFYLTTTIASTTLKIGTAQDLSV